MYYIQRLEHKSSKRTNSFISFVYHHYMGSVEFELGSVGESWKYLKTGDIDIFEYKDFILPSSKEITIYVITTEKGYEVFKEQIKRHITGDSAGHISKEYTGIYEHFKNSDKTNHGWLSVDAFVGSSSTDINEAYTSCFFTGNREFAVRVFLELKRKETPDFKVFDQVLVYKRTELNKICGLNEDDTISIKGKYGKALKVLPEDLWYPEDVKELNSHFLNNYFKS